MFQKKKVTDIKKTINDYNRKMKEATDPGRKKTYYNKNEYVLLTTKNLNRKKLDPRYIRPY
jgi:hypothetical protein